MSGCTVPNCAEEKRINKLEAAVESFTAMVQEMRADIKEVKSVVQITSAMQIENAHMKESLSIAFGRIEAIEREKAHDEDLVALAARVRVLEQARENFDAFLNQITGMKQLAWTLWVLLAGGLGLVILKLFVLMQE